MIKHLDIDIDYGDGVELTTVISYTYRKGEPASVLEPAIDAEIEIENVIAHVDNTTVDVFFLRPTSFWAAKVEEHINDSI